MNDEYEKQNRRHYKANEKKTDININGSIDQFQNKSDSSKKLLQ